VDLDPHGDAMYKKKTLNNSYFNTGISVENYIHENG